MFERVITQTIQTISQQVLRERPLIALGEILEEERIPYRFKPFFETEVYWWLHNEMLARSTNKRFDYENPEVAALLGYLEQVQFRHARFERDEFMSVLDSAVKLSYNYLCRPQITLKWYLFRGQPVKPLREVMLRFGAFVDYSYFFHVFSEWVERKIRERPTFDAISATEFERIIRRVDDQILLSCTVEDLLSMMDPLFEFIGEGDDLIIPIDALIIFFDDKNINKLVEHLERIRERGMTTVGKEEFVGLLDELLTSADENPEADFSNVYQNDELDDVVRMHLQSGAGRVVGESGLPDDPGSAADSVAPGYSEPAPPPSIPTAPPVASHLRAPRPPVDAAFLDALDDEQEPRSSESHPGISPVEPSRTDDRYEPAPAPMTEPADEEVDPERFEREILPEPDPEPYEEEEVNEEAPASSWSAPADEDVNEEIEEWVEGLAEALGEWEESPADVATGVNGNGHSHATVSAGIEIDAIEGDIEEDAAPAQSIDPVDREIEESSEIVIEPAGSEIPPTIRIEPLSAAEPETAKPQYPEPEIIRYVDPETEVSAETPEPDMDAAEPRILIDDTVSNAIGAGDVAPDDLFEQELESDDTVLDQSEPADDTTIYEIVDLEDEFEDDPEGGALEGESNEVSDADLLGDPISGMLSGFDNLVQPEATREEPTAANPEPAASNPEPAASNPEPRPLFEQRTPVERREPIESYPPAYGDPRNGADEEAIFVPGQPSRATIDGMLDVRRYIDAMLERKLVKKIFMRDRAAYDAALDQINSADTWRSASQILDEIFIRYEIDPYSRTALRFTDSVYARYLPAKQ